MLRRLFLLLFLAVSVSAQVPLGATKQEVIDLVGWPASSSRAAGREILNYPDFTVVLKKNQMTNLQFKPGRRNKPLSSYLVSPAKFAPAATGRNSPINAPVSSGPKRETPRSISPAPPSPQSPTASTARKNPSSIPSPLPTLFAAITPGQIILAVIVFVALIVLNLMSGKSRRKRRKEVDDIFPPPPRQKQGEPPLIVLRRETTKPVKPDPLKDGWSLALLKEMEWHRFEHVVAAYERELGNDAELTDFGPDGGFDIRVFEKDSRVLKRVIQCKAQNKQIGVEQVRAFFGAMILEKIPSGAFYATHGFSDDALAISHPATTLEFVNGSIFLNRVEALPTSAQRRLLEVATEGDYTTPTCCNCGIKMARRSATTGRNAGNDFWACSRNGCGQIINLRQH